MTKKLVAVNESGRRIGQDNPNAKLTDDEVELLLRLHEEGWGNRRLARKFDITRRQVCRILRGEQRCQSAARFKAVPSTL